MGTRWFGVALAIAGYLFVMHDVLPAFIRQPQSVPGGATGDQAFYLWAVERGRATTSFTDYINECDWSRNACVNLTAVPQEWRSYAAMGRLARWLGIETPPFLSLYYQLTLLLNVLAAFALIMRIGSNPLLAGVLANVVGFQQSVVWRIQGHLGLIALWPAILAMVGLTHAVDGLGPGSLRSFAAGAILFWLALPITAALSYHYFLFGCILWPILLAGLLALRLRRSTSALSIRGPHGLILFGGFIIAAVATTWLLLPAIPSRALDHRAERAEAYERTLDDVRKCSSRWVDYIKPTALSGALGLYRSVGVELSTRDIGDRWPWETHGFLGATFWIAFVITCLHIASVLLRGGAVSVFGPAAVFGILALATAFLGTAHGGRLIHSCVTGLRCFNRLSPFATLFGCCAIATAWPASRTRTAAFAFLVLGVMFVGEFWKNPILGARLIQPVDKEIELASRMKAACHSRMLSVAPRVADFMFGPYRLYYVAQVAGCRLDGISGPRTSPQAPSSAVAGVVRWGPESNGFEQIVLDTGPGTHQ